MLFYTSAKKENEVAYVLVVICSFGRCGDLLRTEEKEGMKAGAELCGNSMIYIIPLDFYCSKTIRKINVVISI